MQIFHAVDIAGLQARLVHAVSEALDVFIAPLHLCHEALALELSELLAGHFFDVFV